MNLAPPKPLAFAEAPAALKGKYGVYQITHANGAAYIGKAVNIGRRIRGHLSALRNSRHNAGAFERAYFCAGKELFTVTVLFEAFHECPALLDSMEKRWIDNYNATNEQSCLNDRNRWQKSKPDKAVRKAAAFRRAAKRAGYVPASVHADELEQQRFVVQRPAPVQDTNALINLAGEHLAQLKALCRDCDPGTSANIIAEFSTHGTATFKAQLIGPDGELDLVTGASMAEATSKLIANGPLNLEKTRCHNP